MKGSVEFKPHKGENFNIIVKAWSDKGSDKWYWNIYANFHEEHPLFKDIDAAMDLPFPGGVTYDKLKTFSPSRGIKYDWQKVNKTLVLGCDFAHSWDDYDNHPSPFDAPYLHQPFEGHAMQLFEAINNYVKNKAVQISKS